MSYEFRLLGPVELLRSHRLAPIRSAKRRAMLATLALEANRSVSLDQLVEALWSESPPASAIANLRTHAAALRRVLGDRLVARSRGYELHVRDGELDAAEFARLATAGRGALSSGDPDNAIDHLSAALALWRGVAGDGTASGIGLQTRLHVLDERRLDVFEDYVAARLAAPAGPDLIADLRRHLAAHPLRERAWGQLMLAQYRAGNVAAALAAFADARAALADHLGVEPGPSLTQLQRAILDRDATLEHLPRAVTVRAAADPIPRQLPPDLDTFVGRAHDMAALTAALRKALDGTGPRIVAISGRGGIGKTSMAVRAANMLAADFPDGQVVVSLRDVSAHLPQRSPADVLGQVLRALGVPAGEVPATLDERAARYRSRIAGRRTLILVDDVVTAAQVRPLLPGGNGGVLLVTSRRPLATLDGMARLEVGPLAADDGSWLLAAHAGPRVAQDPSSAAKLVRLCAGLPLALRIVGARLASRPNLPLAQIVARLGETPLDVLQFEDLSVRNRFAADYLAMAATDDLAARAFRLLGVLPGGQAAPSDVAAHLDVTLRQALRALEEVVDARLAETPRLGVYRLPDHLLRAYAAELAAEADPRAVAMPTCTPGPA